MVAAAARDLLLQLPPAALEVSCRRRPRVFKRVCPRDRHGAARLVRDVVGGSRLPIFRDRAGASCPLYPPQHRGSEEPPVTTVRSLDLLLVDALCSLSISLFRFSRRAGPGPRTPAAAVCRTVRETRYRPIYCRRAKRLLCENAVPYGLASATTQRSSSCEAACLPAPRLNT